MQKDWLLENYAGPKALCGCSLRKLPPDMLEHLPFEIKKEDMAKIQAWLKDHFRSSSSKVCKTQPLALMDNTPPLKLLVEKKIHLVAVHTVETKPVYWQAKMKADMDQHVELLGLEKVPANAVSS